MSIASAIQNAQTKVAAAYIAISDKGGTLPATQDLSNMPTAINSIQIGNTNIPNYRIDNNGNVYKQTTTYNLTGNEFSNAISIGNNGLYYAFYNCSGLTGVMNFNNVTTIYAHGLYYAFYGCSNLTSINLSSLISIGNNGMAYALGSCSNLSSIYFNSLKTNSFGSLKSQFNNMFTAYTGQSSGGCTIHFPSNLQSTISGLTGYPTFGGNSSRIILAFDLPATS